MKPSYITPQFLESFIHSAFLEDVQDGDHTTLASIPALTKSRAQLLVKETGTLAGVDLAISIFHHLDPQLTIEVSIADGQAINKGDVAFRVEGSARSILTE